MIKRYYLHNFKNHSDTTLDFANLTLLTGMNSSGKSSVIQSLLLLRDSYNRNNQLTTLFLKGDSFSVGQTGDAVNFNCLEDKKLLKFIFDMIDGKKYVFVYKYSSDPESAKLDLVEKNCEADEASNISLFSNNFQYLSAFRYGPQINFERDKDVVDNHHQLSHLMGRGEMTAYYLDKFGEDSLPIDALCYNSESPHTIRTQTMLWMNEISDGLQVQINQYGGKYELRFGMERKGWKTIYHSSMNTGYGISYVLPIIVAILSAKPGSLIIIENPEAHIHPAGQSALMRLAALAVSEGVQIIMETHSDHIINGALVAMKKNVLKKDSLAINFFDIDDSGNSNSLHLEIGLNGLIQNAPDRFFGQMNSDLKVLFDLE